MALLVILIIFNLVGLLPAAGASGFSILRLTSGARTSGLADAGAALADGDAFSVNPAALLVEGGSSFGLTHSEWIEDIRHEYLTAVYRGRGGDVVGLQAQLFHAGGLERRVGPSAEPLGEFGVYEWSVGAAWSRPISARMRLGVGVKLLRQSIFTESASGAAADVGFLYDVSPGLAVGASARNLGGLNELGEESTDLPRQLRLGALARPRPGVMLLADGQWVKGADSSLHLGAEYAWRSNLHLRAGYQTADTRALSMGVGVGLGNWRVDYAVVPFGSGLGEAHRVTLYLSESAGPVQDAIQ
jgi:hypothetical protein